VRSHRFNAVVLLTGMAALFIWQAPWRDPEIPDVVQRISEMQVAERLNYEVHFGHCFGSGELEGWIARESEDWLQAIRYVNRSDTGKVISRLDDQLSRDTAFLGHLSASIYRLGRPGKKVGGWTNTYETVRLDWNNDGHWDQVWAQSDLGWSLTNSLLHGVKLEY